MKAILFMMTFFFLSFLQLIALFVCLFVFFLCTSRPNTPQGGGEGRGVTQNTQDPCCDLIRAASCVPSRADSMGAYCGVWPHSSFKSSLPPSLPRRVLTHMNAVMQKL